MKGTNKIA